MRYVKKTSACVIIFFVISAVFLPGEPEPSKLAPKSSFSRGSGKSLKKYLPAVVPLALVINCGTAHESKVPPSDDSDRIENPDGGASVSGIPSNQGIDSGVIPGIAIDSGATSQPDSRGPFVMPGTTPDNPIRTGPVDDYSQIAADNGLVFVTEYVDLRQYEVDGRMQWVEHRIKFFAQEQLDPEIFIPLFEWMRLARIETPYLDATGAIFLSDKFGIGSGGGGVTYGATHFAAISYTAAKVALTRKSFMSQVEVIIHEMAHLVQFHASFNDKYYKEWIQTLSPFTEEQIYGSSDENFARAAPYIFSETGHSHDNYAEHNAAHLDSMYFLGLATRILDENKTIWHSLPYKDREDIFLKFLTLSSKLPVMNQEALAAQNAHALKYDVINPDLFTAAMKKADSMKVFLYPYEPWTAKDPRVPVMYQTYLYYYFSFKYPWWETGSYWINDIFNKLIGWGALDDFMIDKMNKLVELGFLSQEEMNNIVKSNQALQALKGVQADTLKEDLIFLRNLKNLKFSLDKNPNLPGTLTAEGMEEVLNSAVGYFGDENKDKKLRLDTILNSELFPQEIRTGLQAFLNDIMLDWTTFTAMAPSTGTDPATFSKVYPLMYDSKPKPSYSIIPAGQNDAVSTSS